MIIRRKKTKVIPVRYEIHLARNRLEDKNYADLVRDLISKDHILFFDNLVSKMNRFPINWIEYENGKIFDADGTLHRRSSYEKPRDNIEQRIFLISTRYLQALPKLYAESDRKGIVGLDSLIRYPLIDINNPTEVVYEMDLMTIHLDHPKLDNGQYVSIFSKFAVEHNKPVKAPYRQESA